MGKFTPPTEDASQESPTQEHRVSHSRDMLLRDHKYEINSRPKKGPTLWSKGGKVVTEEMALREIGIIKTHYGS